MAIDPETGHHRAWIMERGGKRRIQELRGLDKVEWNRARDQTSEAKVHVTARRGAPDADFLASLKDNIGRYELCLFRDDEREWEGPLTLPTFKPWGLEVNARDVTHYLARTAMHSGYDRTVKPNDNKSTFVVEHLKQVMTKELARKEALTPAYNILPYLRDHQKPTDARTAALIEPMTYTVFEHLDQMAARGGIDYTVVGRAIHLWDTSQPAMGYTAQLTDRDFLGDIYVSVYGVELATRSIVTDGQGAFGVYGGIDDYYGEVEILASAYDEDATERPTLAELKAQAKRNAYGRMPTPLSVRIPDNSQLNMSGTLKMSDLVPGVYIPLLADLNLVQVSQMQKLQSVKVTEDQNGERVQVVLTPSTKADEPEEEEGK